MYLDNMVSNLLAFRNGNTFFFYGKISEGIQLKMVRRVKLVKYYHHTRKYIHPRFSIFTAIQRRNTNPKKKKRPENQKMGCLSVCLFVTPKFRVLPKTLPPSGQNLKDEDKERLGMLFKCRATGCLKLKSEALKSE